MPSLLKTSRLGVIAVGALLAGCASPAPPLPPDTTSIDRAATETLADFSPADAAMTCLDIVGEEQQTQDEIRVAMGLVYSNQVWNQLGVFGFGLSAYALPGLEYIKGNSREKADIRQEYARLDTLILLGKAKSCKSA